MHGGFGIIVLGRLVGSRHVAIEFVEETLLDLQVEHHVLATVVLARALAELRSLVVSLDCFDRFNRQLLVKVGIAKQALAVHDHADRLAVEVEAVAVHLYSGQLCNEFF